MHMQSTSSNPAAAPPGALRPASPKAGGPADRTLTFEQDATIVLARLQESLNALVLAAPEEVRKAADMERVFGIDHRLGWQVYRIVKARNPLAVGPNVPARVSVERLLKSAGRRGVSPSITERVAEAFSRFEGLIREHAGNRQVFDALIAAALPEEQEKLNLVSREALHNAAKSIRGVAMQTSHITHILYPTKDSPDRLDGLHLVGNFGLHRIRRGATIETSALCRDPSGANLLTVHGEPVTDSTDVLLHEFCSNPQPKIRVCKGEQKVRFVMEGEDVGTQAAINSVFADYIQSYRSRYAQPNRQFAGVAHATDAPANWQVIDVLVCEGAAPSPQPAVEVYDMVPHGQLARIPDPDRELDRVAFSPGVRSMGRGLEAFRCLHVPRYEEMLEFVCAKRKWNPDLLHGYRVEIEFPVYSWQTALTLCLPQQS